MKFPLALAALFLAATFGFSSNFDPVASATNQLGLELFRPIAAARPGKNLLLSPYSIQSALVLAFAGAEGATRTEMAGVLHFHPDDAVLQSSFGAVRAALDASASKSFNYSTKQTAPPDIEWHLPNRLFGQEGYAFRESFLTLLRNGYDAPFQLLDFRGDPETARATINHWVETQTDYKIKNLIPPDGLTDKSRLVLVNALYLKAPWMHRFEKHATEPRPFHLSASNVAQVLTMTRSLSAGYEKRDGFTAVTVPYLTGELQFLILLPDDPDGVKKLAGAISPEILNACSKLPEKKVVLFLPKFRLEGMTLPLGKALQALGMKTAFDVPQGSANFDRIAPRKPDDYLAISDVFHQAFIAVDETGTEATGATAVSMVMTLGIVATSSEIPEVHVDHPFLFAIQHRESGMCLFLGRISDPR